MLYKKKFNLNDILSISLPHIIPKNSRGGLVGLRNLGNTCFMNSALQCLSSCEELTKYFLLKKYTEETNRINKYGSGGKIAKAYYELLSELWTGVNSYLSPYDFRQIFIEFAKQFAGFSQHDSHEMLAFMLDALHEDLNRVKDKPYFELKEKLPEESEEQASYRWWKSHLSRENSIIVDLFHGQYKSTITCPECHRVSITYDPFTNVSVPIPNLSKVDIYVIPLNGLRKNIKLSIYVSKEARFFDILHYINTNTSLEEKFTRVRCMIVNSNKLVKMARPYEHIVDSPNNGYIFCHEIEALSDYINIPVHVAINGELKSFPRLFTLKNTDDVIYINIVSSYYYS